MKRILKILIAIAVALLCLSMCACGFVSYVKYSTETPEDISVAISEYLDRLHALSNEEYYREDERREYLTAVLDAENELRECKSLSELEEVFARHSELILAIPTDLDLTVAYLTEQLKAAMPTNEYREKEQKMLSDLMSQYLEKMQSIANSVEGEKLIYEFKTLAAEIKTDAQYDVEEAAALKQEFAHFGEDIDFSLYPTGVHEELRQLPLDFKEELEKISTGDEGLALIDAYTEKLNSILTLERILAQNVQNWSRIWSPRIRDFCIKYSLDEDDANKCIAKLEAQKTAEAAARIAAEYMLSYADELGAAAIEDMKSAARTYISNIAVLGDYRPAEREQIENTVDEYCDSLDGAANTEALRSIIESAENEIYPILTNNELWVKADNDFALHMQTKYEDLALTPPERLDAADSLDELARIIDYYAFYQLNAESFERGTFRVKLSFPHKYADYVIRDVYWYCELIRSAVGISGYFETDSSQLVITLTPYDIASRSNTDKPVEVDRYDSLIEYDSSSTLTDRAEDFDSFLYYEKYAGRYVKVWNSQQLWFALEHEYIPLPVADSPAEKVLDRAKEILRCIIKDGMSIEEKVFAIYSWYADNVKYDANYWYCINVSDRNKFPDSLVARLNSFHAEGAFFDNLAVCCAYAKSALILMRIEGIEAYRVILHEYEENAIDNLGREGYGSHAIIALRASDGKFYYCDVEQSIAGEGSVYEKYRQLLATAKEQCPYNGAIDRIWYRLDYATEFPVELFWGNLKYNGQSVFVKSEQELRAMVEAFLKNGDTSKQINVFEYDQDRFDIRAVLDTYESIRYETFYYKGFNEFMISISDPAEQ